jgi:hypothetical protein
MKRPKPHLWLALSLILVSCVVCFSQGARKNQSRQVANAKKQAQKRPIEIENLISSARALPAEFAIDALLRIARSGRVVDRRWKQEILEEAFALTPQVQSSLRQRAVALPGTSVDTPSGYRSYAFDLRLDRLSLQSQITVEMLSIDKTRALGMLSEISPKLAFKTLSCSDSLIYDVAEFYEVLGNVTRTAFDEMQIQQGQRLQFLLPYVENVSSPAQVGPIAKLIVSLKLDSRELFIMSEAFGNALKKISGDDRSFSDSLTRDRVLNSVYDLVQFNRKGEAPYNNVTSAIRAYLFKHLKGARCEDNVKITGNDLPSYIKAANYLFPGQPFTLDDVKPSTIEATAKVISFYESGESAALLSDFKSLLRDEGDEPVTKEAKATTQWQQKMLDYLRQLEEWEGRDENSKLNCFHQKCVLYLGLSKIAPAGPAGDEVFLSYLKTLDQDAIMKESRIEWLLHAKELLQIVRESQGAQRSKLLELLIYSKNPVLCLYGGLMKADLL